MKIILNILTAFVALWGVVALAGCFIGVNGVVQGGFEDPLAVVGILILILSIGILAAISIYSVFSLWKYWNLQDAERILSLAAFYAWVTLMMIYPFQAGVPDFQWDPDRFPVEIFLILASVPVVFLIYRFLQERTRRYFTTRKTEP